eukprot:gnl/TRDRNA2_/TRDRNA2_172235_c1_seq5.p1 gnl/TRDRNA2_/TRDRNA2_172235_c1~~gnl/TRDRNA2_/TRDRNA2_172235_c1_seq5.p1  ORF type:complete len:633 (-),score=144.64 gnl/TRDRNA2_/TRDRNA2_172235_c1_seq5:55-1953(-)
MDDGVDERSMSKGGYELVPQNEFGIPDTLDTDLPAEGAHAKAQALISSLGFQSFMAFLITCNSVVIGLETDLPNWCHWEAFEQAFLVVFALEIILRIFALGPSTFFSLGNADFTWNMFDVAVVSMGVTDIIFHLVVGETTGGAGGIATVFRIIRLLRILRIFRIVRFLKQLYMLAFGMVLASVAILWVTILMLFVLYVCSIILVRTVGQIPEDHQDYDFLQMHFGTIFRSMFSLFELMVNPYLDPYHGILGDQVILSVFIIAFVIFGSFGMVALLTGVIHESMFEKNMVRMEDDRAARDSKRKAMIQRCGELFDEIEHDEEGEAVRQELLILLPKVSDMFKDQGMVIADTDFEELVEIMDTDYSGTVSKKEFTAFLLQLAEGLRPMLLMQLRMSITRFVKDRFDEYDQVALKRCEQAESSSKTMLKELLDAKQQNVSTDLSNIKRSILECSQKVNDLQSDMRQAMTAQQKFISETCSTRNQEKEPQQLMGSSSSPYGGIFGRSSAQQKMLNDDVAAMKRGILESLRQVGDDVKRDARDACEATKRSLENNLQQLSARVQETSIAQMRLMEDMSSKLSGLSNSGSVAAARPSADGVKQKVPAELVGKLAELELASQVQVFVEATSRRAAKSVP